MADPNQDLQATPATLSGAPLSTEKMDTALPARGTEIGNTHTTMSNNSGDLTLAVATDNDNSGADVPMSMSMSMSMSEIPASLLSSTGIQSRVTVVPKSSEIESSSSSSGTGTGLRDPDHPVLSPIVPSTTAPPEQPVRLSNPFRDGRVRITHNMSVQDKNNANVTREAFASAPLSSRATSTHQRTLSSASTSAPVSATTKSLSAAAKNKKNNKKMKSTQKTAASSSKKQTSTAAIASAAEPVDKEPEPVVATKYNPAAHSNPIRIYVYGRDPEYVEPAPLQWKAESAKKWEEEKADFVKRGLVKMSEFVEKNDRTCVYYWEWINKDENGERVRQWIFFREKMEGRVSRQNPVRTGLW